MKKAGHSHQIAKTGAVTFIQRFGSALNLNIHFHMIFLDGVYVADTPDKFFRFQKVQTPSIQDLTTLTQQIAKRMAHTLERQGLLEQDAENSYLSWDGIETDGLSPLQSHSITYQIALGPNKGRKVLTPNGGVKGEKNLI